VSNCGPAPAQPPNSPARFAAGSKSPNAVFCGDSVGSTTWQ
jgi:hypothetical protein